MLVRFRTNQGTDVLINSNNVDAVQSLEDFCKIHTSGNSIWVVEGTLEEVKIKLNGNSTILS